MSGGLRWAARRVDESSARASCSAPGLRKTVAVEAGVRGVRSRAWRAAAMSFVVTTSGVVGAVVCVCAGVAACSFSGGGCGAGGCGAVGCGADGDVGLAAVTVMWIVVVVQVVVVCDDWKTFGRDSSTACQAVRFLLRAILRSVVLCCVVLRRVALLEEGRDVAEERHTGKRQEEAGRGRKRREEAGRGRRGRKWGWGNKVTEKVRGKEGIAMDGEARVRQAGLTWQTAL